MSTLVAQTLSNGVSSTSTENCIRGSARAWVNFNGTGTVAIRASYNVSSITDNGTGDYTVNFTNAMVDANYGFAISGNLSSTFGQYLNAPRTTLPTTTALRLQAMNSVGTATDQDYVAVTIFR